MPNDNTPILVGCAMFTQKGPIEDARPPLEILAETARAATDDTGCGAAALEAIDTLLAIGQVIDERGFDRYPIGRLPNQPKSIAKRLDINPARLLRTYSGGNTPQSMVNRVAEEIANGVTEVTLIVGGEFLHSQMKRVKKGEDLADWTDQEDPIDKDHIWGDHRDGAMETERTHALQFPVNVYPMFENGLQHSLGESHEEHMAKVGRFTSEMTKVAAAHPMAWFPTERSPEEIITPTENNRMIGYPYTKYLNAVMQVDQCGALLMMSVAKARELGISEDKWIYFHGCAEASDIWYVTERVNFNSSPAIHKMGEKAFAMAGKGIDDIDYFDLYSCFPSVVQIACQELGRSIDDPRGVTVTGGLPYFGGAGNAYVMLSIATMMQKLRSNPGKYGLCTANGWYITKHAMGIYSTEPFEGDWQREDPASYQTELDAMPHPTLDEKPNGPGIVETYTVVHAREGGKMGLVIGMLDSGKRFIAHTPADDALLSRMEADDFIGTKGIVAAGDVTNLFTPD